MRRKYKAPSSKLLVKVVSFLCLTLILGVR